MNNLFWKSDVLLYDIRTDWKMKISLGNLKILIFMAILMFVYYIYCGCVLYLLRLCIISATFFKLIVMKLKILFQFLIYSSLHFITILLTKSEKTLKDTLHYNVIVKCWVSILFLNIGTRVSQKVSNAL